MHSLSRASLAALLLVGAITFDAHAQNVNNSGQTGNPWSQAGSHAMSGGPSPAASSGCGTGAIVTGSDTAGHILLGTGTSQPCTLTFGEAFINPPSCQVSGETTTVSFTRTRTTLAFTSLVDSTRIHWLCIARAGG